MEEKDYSNLFTLLVKKFNLHKKQSSTDVFIKKGEITALGKILSILEALIKSKYIEKQRLTKTYKDDETSLKKYKIDEFGSKFTPDIYSVYQYIKTTLIQEKGELTEINAVERVFDKLDLNLENSLRDLDLLNVITESRNNPNSTIGSRTSEGICSMTRPGRNKFPCNEVIVPGTVYCKEHLKQFKPDVYFDIFDKEGENVS